MITAQTDTRSEERKRLDELIASEPPLPRPNLPASIQPRAVERASSKNGKHPIAVMGIVENGLVRPLDPKVKLPEHSQVIIVAAHSR